MPVLRRKCSFVFLCNIFYVFSFSPFFSFFLPLLLSHLLLLRPFPSTEQPGTGGTQVNISCVFNLCNPDRSLQLQSLNSSTDTDALAGEDVPLSKEESPIQRVSKAQTAVEVEDDSVDTFAYEEGKPLPLSVQDVGMKTR